ncbi:MAG: phospholipase D-like domain-containing protein [Vulcanisaeta sp.]
MLSYSIFGYQWFIAINSSQVNIVVSPLNSTYILNIVGNARTAVYMETYELTYQPFIDELINLARNGVEVYVVLSGNVYGGIPEEEYTAVNELMSAGAHVSFNYMFNYVHSKVIIIDNDTVIIGSINPTYYGFEKDLGIDLVINNSTIAQILANIVLSDYYNRTITQVSYPGIVVSPINSATYLENLLNQPGTLYMAIEELYPSSNMYNLIQQHSGKIILVDSHAENEYAVNELGAKMINDLTAKVIVVGNYVYVGSINLDYTSLHENRELGIIIENPTIAQNIAEIIQQWNNQYISKSTTTTTQQQTQTTISSTATLILLIVLAIMYHITKQALRPRKRRRIPRL